LLDSTDVVPLVVLNDPQHTADQARDRIREHKRLRRRRARDEQERRRAEEQEREEKLRNAMPQIEAYRREIALRAADKHRRECAEREDAVAAQRRLVSARRERARRYMTPERIREVCCSGPPLGHASESEEPTVAQMVKAGAAPRARSAERREGLDGARSRQPACSPSARGRKLQPVAGRTEAVANDAVGSGEAPQGGATDPQAVVASEEPPADTAADAASLLPEDVAVSNDPGEMVSEEAPIAEPQADEPQSDEPQAAEPQAAQPSPEVAAVLGESGEVTAEKEPADKPEMEAPVGDLGDEEPEAAPMNDAPS